ncbi:MAG: transporter substrate-binding domain-containing protein [Alphaproteobacteria bacterium]|nr:transporter substrate-binding domain-containing protein [Alphaproteobacteria bacterium]
MAYVVTLAAAAHAAESPDAALAALLNEARAAATPDACAHGAAEDRLVRAFCAGHLRIGVRVEYPLFASRAGARREGYEIDVANALAQKLGVEADFVNVKAANRIAMLGDDSVDLVIATMGDNTQRETQVRFVRPHYYQSQTVLVGPPEAVVTGWPDVRDRTVCATVGNASNAELVTNGVRLMLFDDASLLPERLADQTCTFAAQDDSFFAYSFTLPDFAASFSEKFGFSELPWGMGVAREGSDKLARALDLTSQIFHRDGVFLAAARANRIHTAFLERQQAVWSRPGCDRDGGASDPACVLPGANAELQATPFAGQVAAFEHWFDGWSGFELSLPMLKTAAAWSLFLNGAANSLILIAGALMSTLVFALGFGFATGARSPLLRWPARGVTVALQSSPILLTLVITAALMHALVPSSPAMALGAAIVALGLANGSNAGQAIAEAYVTLRAEQGRAAGDPKGLFARALHRSSTQIVAFLINAAKGTPIASFIGAPELLSALTDITSFSSGRATTYTLLLVFYTAVVAIVVWLCRRFQVLFARSSVAA